MVDTIKKKHHKKHHKKEAKKFHLKKKDSEAQKKPGHELAEMEKQMEEEKCKKNKDKKLHRVVQEHQ